MSDKDLRSEGWLRSIAHEFALVPGAGHKSRMDTGFALIWGKFFVPHAKFHFGVSRAQQGQSGKAGWIDLVCPFLTWCRFCRHIRVC